MTYVSTRGGAPDRSFLETNLVGLAPDGGLYVPVSWPALPQDDPTALEGRPYTEIAAEVVSRFAGSETARADLQSMADAAYASFGHPATCPLAQLGPDDWVLELIHGPTRSFKDFAIRYLSMLIEHALEHRDCVEERVIQAPADQGRIEAVALDRCIAREPEG